MTHVLLVGDVFKFRSISEFYISKSFKYDINYHVCCRWCDLSFDHDQCFDLVHFFVAVSTNRLVTFSTPHATASSIVLHYYYYHISCICIYYVYRPKPFQIDYIFSKFVSSSNDNNSSSIKYGNKNNDINVSNTCSSSSSTSLSNTIAIRTTWYGFNLVQSDPACSSNHAANSCIESFYEHFVRC